MSEVEDVFTKMKTEEQNDQEAFAAAQKKYQAVSSGLFSSDQAGGEATLQDQLMREFPSFLFIRLVIETKNFVWIFTEAKGIISKAETDRKQCEMQIEHQKEQLKTKEAELKKTASSFASDQKQLDKYENEIATYKVINLIFCFLAYKNRFFHCGVFSQSELSKLNYEDGLLETLQQEKRELISEIRPLEDFVANIKTRLVPY